MTNLETRLNVTTKELATIKENVIDCLHNNMDEDLGLTNTDLFEMVLNETQMKDFKNNATTKAMCLDLLKG